MQVTPPQKDSGKPVPISTHTHTHVLLPEANQMLQGNSLNINISLCMFQNQCRVLAMKIEVNVLQTDKVAFGQVASCELVDLLRKTML